MDKTLKVLIIAMAVLVIIVPIGLIATGTAFGEWGSDELQESIGYIPSGLEQLSDLWHPILPDYDFATGDHDTLPTQAPGYYLSAIIGVLLCAGIGYLIGKAVVKKSA
ncbi:MAG: PDGLE domain-containing protein [Methanoregula sp.]